MISGAGGPGRGRGWGAAPCSLSASRNVYRPSRPLHLGPQALVTSEEEEGQGPLLRAPSPASSPSLLFGPTSPRPPLHPALPCLHCPVLTHLQATLPSPLQGPHAAPGGPLSSPHPFIPGGLGTLQWGLLTSCLTANLPSHPLLPSSHHSPVRPPASAPRCLLLRRTVVSLALRLAPAPLPSSSLASLSWPSAPALLVPSLRSVWSVLPFFSPRTQFHTFFKNHFPSLHLALSTECPSVYLWPHSLPVSAPQPRYYTHSIRAETLYPRADDKQGVLRDRLGKCVLLKEHNATSSKKSSDYPQLPIIPQCSEPLRPWGSPLQNTNHF